ncbi:flagellar basal body rod protein FlgC [Niveibacterium sp. COAC-50]|uniref:flagellar basal body rod protein FlgC n=1 Tax=Niveibacterium sp. COAC-50 TaxID=2729384 RepID=UPI001551ADDE|nr:flagellar basal body rod C-terminal domain-containing protein [Niveibacterium sp. COAC-50]
MNFSEIARISASGLALQKARVEAATLNLANIGTVADASGRLYQPLTAVAEPSQPAFAGTLTSLRRALLGAGDVRLVASERAPVKSYEPGHPMADAQGYVSHPDIDHLNEMMTINGAVRAYEANLAAVQTARQMCSKALEIGSGA